MADREKVIAGLTMLVDRKNDDTCEGLKCCKIAEDALALLKEQEAVKPFIQISEHTGRKWLTCGACEYPIESEKESWEEIYFCPRCGKPILWEGR